MKSDVLGPSDGTNLYPWLGDFDNTVVLFHKAGAGVVVSDTSNSFRVGFYDEDWDMSNFVDFCGDILLSN